MKMNRLGPLGPAVSSVCVGTSPLGGMPEIYGYDVDAERAVATVRRVLDSTINFLDTSNEYGDGESERRIGTVLREGDRSGREFFVASKADPARGGHHLDADRVRASFHESVDRLGVETLDVFYLHDPERFEFDDMIKPGGAVDGMRALKDEGLVGLIGVAGGAIPEMHRYLDTCVFDVLLNHNQFTLLDRSADPLIDAAVSAGVAFVNAAPYASGILAAPLNRAPRYQYRIPDPSVIQTVTWLHEACGEFDVPLAALALQFSSRDPRISSTVVGVSAPQRVDQLEQNEELDIPQELWDVVEARLRRS
jgi:D-threo-aldose 1-dehydrogenase